MNILVVGSGGREHALCWRLSQSASAEKIWCAPGNAGIKNVATCFDLAAEDVDGQVALAKKLNPDLIVVGPEAPLVAGLSDALRAEGFHVFGPSQAAAQLEGSKAFMKAFCKKHAVPTAAFERFTDADAACAYIDKIGAPIVIKTSGLAAGKGVIIAMTTDEAKAEARAMLSGSSFGDAGKEIVIEEFMDGEELSYFALCSGDDYLVLGSAQDHKRVGEGDTGLNTGGMGAYSPAHLLTHDLEKQIQDKIIEPTLRGMIANSHKFDGVLFAGIMIVKGQAKLIEYNVRFGDPECQALMMRTQGDFAKVLMGLAQSKLSDVRDEFSLSDDHAMCVVMAANGYPGSYQKNTVIEGFDMAEKNGAIVFHAGTKTGDQGEILANGGRVLGVTATGQTIETAHTNAYKAVDQIKWDDGFCRRDIGWRALKSEKAA